MPLDCLQGGYRRGSLKKPLEEFVEEASNVYTYIYIYIHIYIYICINIYIYIYISIYLYLLKYIYTYKHIYLMWATFAQKQEMGLLQVG